jgi:uncharacterized coiled-coil protein SlyX
MKQKINSCSDCYGIKTDEQFYEIMAGIVYLADNMAMQQKQLDYLTEQMERNVAEEICGYGLKFDLLRKNQNKLDYLTEQMARLVAEEICGNGLKFDLLRKNQNKLDYLTKNQKGGIKGNKFNNKWKRVKK